MFSPFPTLGFMPTYEEVQENHLLANIREDYFRLSTYIMSDVKWLYNDEFKDEEIYLADINMTKLEMVYAILNHRYGKEKTMWALKKLKIRDFPS